MIDKSRPVKRQIWTVADKDKRERETRTINVKGNMYVSLSLFFHYFWTRVSIKVDNPRIFVLIFHSILF